MYSIKTLREREIGKRINTTVFSLQGPWTIFMYALFYDEPFEIYFYDIDEDEIVASIHEFGYEIPTSYQSSSVYEVYFEEPTFFSFASEKDLYVKEIYLSAWNMNNKENEIISLYHYKCQYIKSME